jgi:hypothetical protein
MKAAAAGLPEVEIKLSRNISDIMIVSEAEFTFQMVSGY